MVAETMKQIGLEYEGANRVAWMRGRRDVLLYLWRVLSNYLQRVMFE